MGKRGNGESRKWKRRNVASRKVEKWKQENVEMEKRGKGGKWDKLDMRKGKMKSGNGETWKRGNTFSRNRRDERPHRGRSAVARLLATVETWKRGYGDVLETGRGELLVERVDLGVDLPQLLVGGGEGRATEDESEELRDGLLEGAELRGWLRVSEKKEREDWSVERGIGSVEWVGRGENAGEQGVEDALDVLEGADEAAADLGDVGGGRFPLGNGLADRGEHAIADGFDLVQNLVESIHVALFLGGEENREDTSME